MRIIYNRLIPFKEFLAVNLFGIVFVRKESCPSGHLDITTRNHEYIHTCQMREMLYIFFYLWYVIEYVVRLFQKKFDADLAYRSISFEREAHCHQWDFGYTDHRRSFSWIKYL